MQTFTEENNRARCPKTSRTIVEAVAPLLMPPIIRRPAPADAVLTTAASTGATQRRCAS